MFFFLVKGSSSPGCGSFLEIRRCWRRCTNPGATQSPQVTLNKATMSRSCDFQLGFQVIIQMFYWLYMKKIALRYSGKHCGFFVN